MKHIVITLAFVALAFPALAQEGDKDFNIGEFTFGVWKKDSDTISSKFLANSPCFL